MVEICFHLMKGWRMGMGREGRRVCVCVGEGNMVTWVDKICPSNICFSDLLPQTKTYFLIVHLGTIISVIHS